jgi:amino acid adenylation domain-containing protein
MMDNPFPRTWSAEDTCQSIPERFEKMAALHGAKLAIGGTLWQPSFAELNAVANRNAAILLELGREERGRVALLMSHDAPLIAAALSILKAGKTVVALNPTDPPARLEQTRSDAEPELVITDRDHRNLALRAGFVQRDLLLFDQDAGGFPDGDPGVAIEPHEVAFLIYTSGSTGTPNGVMQTHRNILHNVLRYANGLGFRESDRVTLLASLSGGQGLGITWTALLTGARLCPFATMEKGVTGLSTWLIEHGITVYISSASLFRHFAKTLSASDRFLNLRLVRLGSEQVMRSDFKAYRRHFSEGSLFANAFSSSEVGNITQYLVTESSRLPPEGIPVGNASEGIEILLLDEIGNEVGRGETGEIVVRSQYLSPGYWRNPALTSQRFFSDPRFKEVRTFHSGDLGRLLEDGSLTVTGRKDKQVKVRGYRIELFEVEAALMRHPQVKNAAVCAVQDSQGDTQLTAYVIPQSGSTPRLGDFRETLRLTMPDFMVPNAFAFLDAFPLTPHGKIDRQKLVQFTPASPEPAACNPPETDTEELVAALWSDALQRDAIGKDDDFFELGGESLSAVVVAARIHASLDVEVALSAFVENSTVAKLAQFIDRRRTEARDLSRPPLVRVPREQPLPLSFAQERCWRYSQTPEGSAGWVVSRNLRVKGELDLNALRQSVNHIIRRHEILRTTFEMRNGRPMQIIHPAMPLYVPFIDLANCPDALERADALLKKEIRRPFNLALGPLLRLHLVRIARNDYRLVRINHHIIWDGWSWNIFLRELSALYGPYHRGETPPLPAEVPLQYADYAVWQRRCLRPGEKSYQDEVAWWSRAFESHTSPAPFPFLRKVQDNDAAVSEGFFSKPFNDEVSRRLDQVGREEGATYFIVRLAGFAAQYALDTDQQEIVLGTYFTGRLRAEVQGMFGFFADLRALRMSFTGNPSFREWVAKVRKIVIEAQARTEIPYEQLCEELCRQGVVPPVIQMIFSLTDLNELRFDELEISDLGGRFQTMPWGLTFSFARSNPGHTCRAKFDARIYEPTGVISLLERYLRTLDHASLQPDRPLREIFCKSEGPFR